MSPKRSNNVVDTDLYCTPPDVLEDVRRVGPIAFDPFPGDHSLVAPRIAPPPHWDAFATGARWDCPTDDDCVRPDEVLWGQPPYSRGNLPLFADRWEKLEFNCTHGIALLPSRTGAAWFSKMVGSSTAIVYVEKRIVFWLNGEPADGGGRFDSVLFYSGARPHLFLDVFRERGRGELL